MGDVVSFPGITKLDFPPERILNKALEHDLDRVVVIGQTKDGEFYFASSAADGGVVLWDLERARHKLMLVVDEIEKE